MARAPFDKTTGFENKETDDAQHAEGEQLPGKLAAHPGHHAGAGSGDRDQQQEKSTREQLKNKRDGRNNKPDPHDRFPATVARPNEAHAEARQPSRDRHAPDHYQLIPSNSTSKTSVALGGMTPPAPRAP